MKNGRMILGAGLVALLLGVALLAPGPGLANRSAGAVPAHPQQIRVFTGNVYRGHEPDTSTPLDGVTVTLYGSNDANVWGDKLDDGITDDNGAYTLSADQQVYEYYHIVETDPPGYHSTSVQAGTGGTEVNYNWIRYENPPPGTYEGNLFWDEVPPTATPTPTRPPHPTCTPTPTPTGVSEPRADLELDKVDFPDPVAPGALITYTLVVTNHGPSPAPNVVVTEELPSQVSYVSDTDNCVLVENRPPRDVLRCELGDMAPGASVSFQIVARVDDDACGLIHNWAEVRSENGVPDPVPPWNNWAYRETLVAPCKWPIVLIRKWRIEPFGLAQLGDIITFEIEIVNIGNTEFTAVSLTDTYNSRLVEFLDASRQPSQVTVSAMEGIVTWSDLTAPPPYGFGHPLPPGGRFILHVRFRAIGIGINKNCAEVLAQGEGMQAEDESCSWAQIIDPSSVLQISKTLDEPSGGSAVISQTVRFYIEVANVGDEPITELRLHDEYDTAYLSFRSAAFDPDDPADDGSLDWSDLTQPSPNGFGRPLDPGMSVKFSINFHADSATPPDQPTLNCVRAVFKYGDVPDQETSEYCVPLVIVREPEPGLEVEKILYDPPDGVAQPGDLVRFKFKITNTGDTELTNVALEDTYDTNCLRFIPTGVESIDPDDPTDDGHLDWSHWLGLTSLGPGMSIETIPGVQFQAKAGANCDPTTNHLEGVATDQHGHPVSDADDEPVRIVIVPLPTDTPTPTATPVGYRLYLPLIMKMYPLTPIFSADFNDGRLTGWTPNMGTWTNPGTHMRGEYALGNAWNMRSETGSDIVYEGTLNLLSGNAVGLVFRSSADGTSSYDVILDAVDGVFKISKRPPYQVLASYSMAVQRNHPYRVKVMAKGNKIEAYLDGVKRLTVTDSTYSSGQLGVMLFQATATYDDLAAWELP